MYFMTHVKRPMCQCKKEKVKFKIFLSKRYMIAVAIQATNCAIKIHFVF